MSRFSLIISICLFVSGCVVFPMQTVMPLEAKIIDAHTAEELKGIRYLRIVCDLHDYGCNKALLEDGVFDSDIKLENKRQWGLYIAAPGGLPVPNHQIAIWKEGYSAIVFSQYDDNINDFAKSVERIDIKDAINEIPTARRQISPSEARELFFNGTIKLEPIVKNN